jgi:hypothetical protein
MRNDRTRAANAHATIFFISSLTFVARGATARSELCCISFSCHGTTCHETP